MAVSKKSIRRSRRPRRSNRASSRKAASRKSASKVKSRLPPKAQSSRRAAYGRRIQFADVKGRTVETIEFFTSPDYHSISVNFDDKTSLSLDIEPVPGFTVSPIYQRWKAGNSRVLRSWPVIRSEE